MLYGRKNGENENGENENVIKKKFFQRKLNYIHFNPCQQHWNFAASPEEYKWSLARFYETGVKGFD